MFRTVSLLLLSLASSPSETAICAPLGSIRAQDRNSASASSELTSRLQRAAEAGDVHAQLKLGKAYRDGEGVPQNDVLAFKWLRRAAEQDDPDAENDLGILYGTGKGVERDKQEAVRWYGKAAKQGNARAMFNLGAAYYNGDGVNTDDTASYAWFLLANEAGYPQAQEAVRRAESETKLDPAEGFTRIAQMYDAGIELPKDSKEVLKWYRKAGDAGGAEADVQVAGILLAQGRAANEDEYLEARRRCERAAERYSPGAYCMAVIYKKGLGVAADPVQTVTWLNRSADLGHSRAALDLAGAYWKGDGVRPKLETAYMWVWIAFSCKVPGAEEQEEAIRKQMTAKEIARAKKKALEWLQKHRSLGLHRRTAQVSPGSNQM